MSNTATVGHDNLHIPVNNVLDGREYETTAAFLYPDDLREGDVITTGAGVYQVGGVGDFDAQTPKYVRHIRISHTLAGPVMGGLLRGQRESVQVMARRRQAVS